MNDASSVLGLLMQQIGSANWSQWQVQRWSWYDFVRLVATGASTTSLNFFTTPQGGSDPNAPAGVFKTKEQTNIVKANSFGQQYFVLQQIRTVVQPLVKSRQNATVAADTTYSFDQGLMTTRIRQLMSTGLLKMIIGQKQYWDIHQPFRTCPPGFGLTNVIVPFAAALTGTANFYNGYIQGSNELYDVYSTTPPQLIEPEQLFQMTIDFPDLGYNFSSVFDTLTTPQNGFVEAGIILDGYLARPVQ